MLHTIRKYILHTNHCILASPALPEVVWSIYPPRSDWYLDPGWEEAAWKVVKTQKRGKYITKKK